MSNYTKENLIAVPPTDVPAGTLAIKIGDEVFTAGRVAIGTDTSDATAVPADVAEGKIFYGVEGRLIGTATGSTGSDDSLRTILYMPMNGDLSVYGKLEDAFISPLEESPWGDGSYAWTPTFDAGVFSGEQALSFRAVERDDEGYPVTEVMPRYVSIPLRFDVTEGDFTVDLWLRPDSLSGESNVFVIGGSANTGIKCSGSGYGFMFWGSALLSAASFPSGAEQWYHMALVRSGDMAYGFVNGSNIFAKSIANYSASEPYYNEASHTGRGEGEPVFRIAHLRFSNYALWTADFTPPTKDSYAAYME